MFRTKVVDEIQTNILHSVTSFFSENRVVYEIMWKKCGTVRQATDGSIIRRVRVAYWIPKATNTLSVYVILISSPRQQWLRERASMLRLYLHCLS